MNSSRCLIITLLLAGLLAATTSAQESARDAGVSRIVRNEAMIRAATTTATGDAAVAEPTTTYTPLRRDDDRRVNSATRPNGSRGRSQATATVAGSLVVVLAAFFLLVWLSRKAAPQGQGPLPGEVVQSLGRVPLTARQQMQLIRVGNKLVLLAVTTQGAEPLTEITDADEVNRLCGLCQQGRAGSISDSFRQVLAQSAREPARGGFVGNTSVTQVATASRAASGASYGEAERG